MDFNDTPSQRAFREKAYAWLKDNAVEKHPNSTDPLQLARDEDVVKRAKAWQQKKASAQFSCLSWPKKYGGQGTQPIEAIIYEQEEAKFDVPANIFLIGIGMCAPTLMAYASDQQKSTLIPKIASGEHIWCQLFSEPGAGSDLAGLRTKAEKDGDNWLITGQKIWTSGAHYSDYGLIVVRTDFNVPKHQGLTVFFLDMKSEGIDIRPIKQISGDAHFNEVFFDHVAVPDSQRLGDVGAGWQVALVTLMNERLAIRDIPGPDITALFELAQQIELENGKAIDNDYVRQKLAHWYSRSQGIKNTQLRLLSAISKGKAPGPEAAITKLVSAKQHQDIAAFGMDLLDQAGFLNSLESFASPEFTDSLELTDSTELTNSPELTDSTELTNSPEPTDSTEFTNSPEPTDSTEFTNSPESTDSPEPFKQAHSSNQTARPNIKAFKDSYLRSPGYRIAGGTDEILRTIIAERILGLPQDLRADKGLAFKDVPKGSSN